MPQVFKIILRSMLIYLFLGFISIACTTQKYQDRIQSIKTDDCCTELPGTMRFLTWNIGYGALGKNADFIADGGKSLFPSNKKQMLENCNAIIAQLNEIDADIIFFEEMAGESSLTHGINLFDSFRKQLPQYTYLFYAPNYTNYLGFLNLNIGNAIFSKIKIDDISVLELGKVKQHPLGPEEFHHFLKAKIALLPDKKLILYLVHLPAFDKKAEIRFKHLQILKDDFLLESTAGNSVLCAGDWNLRLVPTHFASTTKEKYLEWIFDRPVWFTPFGWEWHFDPSVPTVRTLERTYREGENYTTIIDGIMTSPEVVVQSSRTFNFGFENSDHNPVYAEFTMESRLF